MPGRMPVYIVCSPLTHVGKTLLARLATEFFVIDGRRVEAFDLSGSRPSLIDYLPGCTLAADLADTRRQMAFFDRLMRNDAAAKIVDLGSAAFLPFFSIAAQIDLAAEAGARNIELVVLLFAGADRSSAATGAAIGRQFPEALLVPVHSDTPAYAGQPDRRGVYGRAGTPLRLPPLAPELARIVARPGFSFADLRAGKILAEAPRTRAELHAWTKRAMIELRELELRRLLSSLGLANLGLARSA